MPKKLLIIGKRGGILQWYENILAAAHHSPDYEIQGFALNHNNTTERFLKKILLNKDVYTANLLKKKLQAFQPDVVLIADLFYFNDHLLQVLADFPCKKAHWIGDFFDERLLRSKNIIDLYLFTDSSFINDAKAIGLSKSAYLPLAYNPAVFYPGSEQQNDRLLFVGAWSPNRQELIEKIPLPITIYGKGWDKLTKADSIIHPQNISLTKVAKLYRNHRYILNLINKKNIRQGMNMRCFEAPACSCILVSEYVADLENAFDVNNEIITFENPDELQIKFKETIINPELAMHKVQQSHTYKNRLDTIVSLLTNL
ncbi:CgeB family protein [Acinetobacter pittii]|uniref:CgeB family protein n=1 Tax=Acinetobacter pittii TaxID=48296 RepID=UPI00300DBB42